ncbi:MAG: alpha/beta hydrolase, partial [Planctomycetota bacterium]
VDKANANFAIRQFRRLLEFLAAHTSAEGINIIAHSAGNPIAIEALRQLSLMHYDLDDEAARRRTRISRVILAAPGRARTRRWASPAISSAMSGSAAPSASSPTMTETP